MDPPGEQRSKPRKRDRIKNFFKDPLGSRTALPSHSRSTSHPTVAGGTGTSSRAAHDVAVPTPPAENTTGSEIQSNQDNINTAIDSQPRQDLSGQAIQSASSEVIPAQNEGNTFLPSTSTSGHNSASRVSSPFPPSGPLAIPRGEAQGGAPIQDHGVAVVEGDPWDLLPPAQSNVPATVANEAQESTAHVEHQPAGLAGKIYEGVKTTLRKVVEVSDVFPPLKSVAAGLLVICDTVDVSLSLRDVILFTDLCVGVWRE